MGVNALPTQSPKALRSMIENLNFFAAPYRHLPDAGRSQFGVIDKLAIQGFKRLVASLLCHLHGRAALRGLFPDLPISAPVGTEINPPAIFGPARTYVIRGSRSHTAYRTSIRADHVNVRIARVVRKKGDQLIESVDSRETIAKC
jgi:hypothetical protein